MVAFNDLQKKIIDNAKSTNVVIAGAGVGKTATIIGLLQKLHLKDKTPLSKFFVVTFTNKSAKDLKNKIKNTFRLDKDFVAKLWVGTFHALAYRYLKEYCKLDSNIMIQNEANILLKTLHNELLIKYGYTNEKISLSEMVRALDLSRATYKPLSNFTQFPEFAGELKINYDKAKKSIKVLDFEDILEAFYNNIKSNENFLNHFDWYFVDEAQDNHYLQNQITDIFFKKNCICVGDPKQSIYRFRGATPNLFMERYNKAFNKFNLNINYRSSKPILDFANVLIKQKEVFKDQILKHSKTIGAKPIFYCAENPIPILISNIQRDINKGTPLNEIAILSRSVKSVNILNLQIALKQANLKYEVRGGLDSLNSTYAQNYLSLLKTLCCPNKLSVISTLQLISNIGPKIAMQKAEELSYNSYDYNQISWQGGYTSSTSFRDFIKLTNLLDDSDILQESLKYIYNHYLLRNFKLEDANLKKLNIENSIVNYLKTQVSIVKGIENLYISENEEDNSKSIILSNIHVSKGLEWSSVHIYDFYEGSIPAESSFKEVDEDEEFCLAYVAVTRAKDSLYMYMPTFDMNKRPNKLSRYLKFIYKNTKESVCDFRFIRPDEREFKEKLFLLLNDKGGI